MKKNLQERVFTLKLFQFIGGMVSVIVGTILVALDVNDPARITIGTSGLEIGISAISGVAVIIAGIFLFFRSGGGVKAKSQMERKRGKVTRNRIEFTVDASRDYQDGHHGSSITCPDCNHEIGSDDIYIYCICDNCKKEWKQRLPS